jgi:inorganic pyrophosphatase
MPSPILFGVCINHSAIKNMNLLLEKINFKAMTGSAVLVITFFAGMAAVPNAFSASSNPSENSEILVGERNFLTGYPAVVSERVVNVVVEIPAGTSAKWEVSADGDTIHWEIKKGKPRVIDYLPYPANYGMVPRTRLPIEEGGDGDPLDVLILGPATARGAIVPARPVAVLRLLDDGEQDDKILAVPLSGPLSDVTGLKSLNQKYPGVVEIIRAWFANYKGDKIEIKDTKGSKTAWKVVEKAVDSFRE